MLEYMEGMREKWSDMIADVELVERLEQEGVREPTVEEIEAADAARPSVLKWRAGGETWSDMIAAVKVCEGFEGGGVEPTVEEMAAADAARLSVQKWRDGYTKGLTKGRKNCGDSLAAVKVC